MKKTFFLLVVSFLAVVNLIAQKIVPIEHNGKKYEVLDQTAQGKVMWGGYEEIALDAAKSESNGTANTKSIVFAVGKNAGFEGKPYAAKLCSEAKDGGKNDWYLPSKEESDAIYAFKDKFNVEERGSIWTSTEANGTQAVTKYWYNGAYYNNQKVEEYNYVCIRKVE
ncbi:MAG: hypothetical protein WBC06_03150 [Chitinophagaceae bacterium]